MSERWQEKAAEKMRVKLNPTLNDVHKVYKKWLHVDDEKRIELGLAVALTRKAVNSPPIWLIIVSPSGDWKSEQINALYEPEHVVKLDRLTSKTLISGSPKVDDMAPKLKDKLILFSDFASMLKAHPQEKAEIFAQLRELYDGRAGGSYGTGKHSHYENLRTTWLIGSTPAIDRQILIHQDLGTRELVYRPYIDKDQLNKLKARIIENRYSLPDMRAELREVTTQFLKKTELQQIELKSEVLGVLYALVDYLAVMRANAACDSYSGELLSDVDMERPTRVLQQYVILYEALKSLRPDYPDERACEILRDLTFSSSNPNRSKIFSYLKNFQLDKITTSAIAKALKIGVKTAYSECFALWNLGILNRGEEEVGYKEVKLWSIDMENELTRNLLKIDDSLLLLLD